MCGVRAYCFYLWPFVFLCVFCFSQFGARSRFYRLNEFLVCVSFSLSHLHSLASIRDSVFVCLCLSFLWSNKNNIYSTLLLFGCGIRVRSVFVIGSNEVFEVHIRTHFHLLERSWIWFVFFYDFFLFHFVSLLCFVINAPYQSHDELIVIW